MSAVEVLSLLPLVVLLAVILSLLGVIAFKRNHRLASLITQGGLIAAFISLLSPLQLMAHVVTPLLVFDPFAVFYSGLILVASFVIALLSFRYMSASSHPEEYYVLLLTATLGAVILTASDHFASFFLGLEILSVSLYALIAYFKNAEAGVKYLVLAGTSSAILLFGMALIYYGTGTLRFSELAPFFQKGSTGFLASVGAVMILVGIAFKLALAPFHMWAPDVYEGAPLPVTSFIATVSKGAVFAILLRYALLLKLQSATSFVVVVTLLALVSMTAGNFLALLQGNLKRLLAYSSTAHLGYLLIAVLAGTMGDAAGSFYILAYFATTLAAFGVLIVLSTPEHEVVTLSEFRGLLWLRPGLATILSISLLSLAGIPLTAGFSAKFFLASAAIHSSLWLLAIVLMVNSAIGLFYYLRVVAELAADFHGASFGSISAKKEHVALFVVTAAIVWIGVFPSSTLHLVQGAVQSWIH